MSANAGNLLWSRSRVPVIDGQVDFDTGLRQSNLSFGSNSVDEPPLGVTAVPPGPAPGDLPASRVMVIPLPPLAVWSDITIGEPYLDPTTGTVHVRFGATSAKTINVLFWDPHSAIGPGLAATYNEACFTSDTPVWTPTGMVPIHTLREGDLVLAWDGASAQPRKITKLHRHTVNHHRLIDTGDGALIKTTDNHPFLVQGDHWAPIGALAVGDHLNGRDHVFALTRSERVEGSIEVLNIEVDDLHTYLVGPHALVVHNK